MLRLFFNLPGLLMVAVALALGIFIGNTAGLYTEGEQMMIAGVLLVTTDLAYRLTRVERYLFDPSRGGRIFFFPIWVLGVFWFILGALYAGGRVASQ